MTQPASKRLVTEAAAAITTAAVTSAAATDATTKANAAQAAAATYTDAETTRATAAEATKVNSSTYTTGLAGKADASALTTETTRATTAETALQNGTNSTFETRLSGIYAPSDGRRVVAGAVGSGGADTAKIADAIAAAKAAGGRQCIQLQPGAYSVDPGALILDFDNVLLTGAGTGVTSITKTGNGDLITIKAASDAGVVQRAQVRDMKLNGGDFTGALVKSVYGSQCHIKGIEFNANNDITLDLIRPWDTVLDDVFLDHCGATDGSVPALSIRNSAAASGFGFSAGQANMVYARALRIESCRRALQVVRGTGSSNDPYGIYFHGLKLETYFARGIQIDVVNVRGVSFRDVDMSLLGLDAGASAVTGFDWAPLFRSKLDGVRFNVGSGVVGKGVDVWLPGSGSHEIANITGEGSATGNGLLYHNNFNPSDIRGCTVQAGTLHGNGTPTTDATVRANTQTASYTLVAADRNVVIEMNVASANALTVPPNSSVAFPVGTLIEVHQYGAGQTTITPGAGVTIRTSSSLTTRAQYSTVSLRKRATDEWVCVGDLT